MTTANKHNKKAKSDTKLERLRNMEDKDIDTSDSPEVSDAAWANAVVGNPLRKKLISVRLDADVIEWFKSGGPNYQTRMNQVLRVYMEHCQKAKSMKRKTAAS
jgi:uncharacterized protein (DUF4415 family)